MCSVSDRPAEMPHRSVAPLIIRLPNWVGDVCMALPAITALVDAGHSVVAVGKGWSSDLLAGHPGIRCERLPSGLWQARRFLRELATSLDRPRGLLLTNSLGSALQFRLAGISACGHAGEGRSPLLGRAVSRPRGGHEVQTFWRLARETDHWLGNHHIPEHPPAHLGLRLHDRHRIAADQALASAGIVGDYVVLAPLAAGTIGGRSKIWPGFPLLCRLLREAGHTVVACPGPGEDAACAAALPGGILLPGLSLGAYAAVCARARITVANDSGPMHLAAAVDAPVIGLFGVADPGRTRPWSPGGIALGNAQGWPTVEDVWKTVG